MRPAPAMAARNRRVARAVRVAAAALAAVGTLLAAGWCVLWFVSHSD